jgi:hypothetical protein
MKLQTRLGSGVEKYHFIEALCPNCRGWSHTLYSVGFCPCCGVDFFKKEQENENS